MKRIILIPVLLMLMVVSPNISAQRSVKQLNGSWGGKLTETGMSITLIFHFNVSEDSSVKATLDSPDQSVKNLPLGKVTMAGDSVFVEAPMLNGRYSGVFTSDSTIAGRWFQLGKGYPMELVSGMKPVVRNRPQEPAPPYPYTEEEVVFRNRVDNFDLAGSLTIPEGHGPFPAVVLITGSGGQDRDETLFGHKPFKVIADYLTRNGIAVLRYDDRGMGRSQGNATMATSLDLANDAAAAVDFLLSRKEIDGSRIGLAGHSEGGLIAPIVASGNNKIAFLISLAGPGVSGREIVLRQSEDISRAMGTGEDEIKEALRINGELFKMVTEEPDQRKFATEALKWYGGELDKENLAPDERRDKMISFSQGIVSINNPWMRYFLATDPSQFWQRVKCPVLAMNGEKDLQVNYEVNLTAIKAALKEGGNRSVKTAPMPGLNHLFQHCTTGAPSEYLEIEETFAPEALKLMKDWILKTVK